MFNKLRNTKYFQYLLENFNEINGERIAFNNEIISLLNREIDELGMILKCHLIIEYYIDNYLKIAYPTILNWQSSRLSFSQKLEIINNASTPIGMFYSSIKCLNSIRNKFSHKISYRLLDIDYREIKEVMFIWKDALGEPVPKGLKLIESFTVWVCGSINGVINGINKHANKTGLSGYLDWLQEMQNEESK